MIDLNLKRVQKFQKIHRWWLKPQCDLSLWPGELHFTERVGKQFVYLNVWISAPGVLSYVTWHVLDLGIFNDAFYQIYEYATLLLKEGGIKYSFIDEREVKHVTRSAYLLEYQASDNRYAQRRAQESVFRDSKIGVLFNLPIEQMLTHDKDIIRQIAVQRIEAQEKLKHVPQQSPRQTRSYQRVLEQKARR